MTVIRITLGVALMGTGLFFAAPAHADEYSYVWNLEHDTVTHFYGNKLALITLGYAICVDLAQGNTISEEASVVLTNPNFDFNLGAARAVVLHAEENLC